MTTPSEPTPPSRRDECFPKTTTIPEGWNTTAFDFTASNAAEATEICSQNGSVLQAVPGSYGHSNGKVNHNGASHSDQETSPQEGEAGLFTHGLEPFPKTNTFPEGWDVSGMRL